MSIINEKVKNMITIKAFILFFLISISSVQAASLYLSPQSKTGLTPGNTFSVDVKADVKDMLAYQFKLSWDKNILECVKATPHPEKLWSKYIQLDNSITTGKYSIAYSVSQPTSGFTGTISLVTLQFKVKGTGQTKISFSDVFMFDSKVKNISFTATDGSFDNRRTSTIPIIRGRTTGIRTLGISEELLQPLIVLIALIVLFTVFIVFKFFVKKT
jgi:hypothetical protein